MARGLQAAHDRGFLFTSMQIHQSHCWAWSLLHQWKVLVKKTSVSHDAMASNATVQLVVAVRTHVQTHVTGLTAGLARSRAAALSAPNNAAGKEQSEADAVLCLAPIGRWVVAPL